MPLVLSERDYKLVTLFSKVAGLFTFAAGSVVLVDHGRVWLGLGLIVLGSLITLAPVPLTVVQPDTYARAMDDELVVNE
jgi:hypothetical protein